MDEKEEYAIILDFLPNGYPFDTRPMHKKTPIAQAIGEKNFTLLELIPKKGVMLQPAARIYIGEGKREEIHHISGKLNIDKLTETAKGELEYVINGLIEKDETRFVKFFNDAMSINTRRHQLELIPGIGKKHMWEIIEKREEKPFESFNDIKNRIKLLASPKKAIAKRILKEIWGKDKYKLFVR